mmetsp:Transcript_6854/g.10018  ORF Transcript_6854/g.10018 Transcript_6854/m.10018 type:complete len:949 (+) Transcript_6854:39-2885(+)
MDRRRGRRRQRKRPPPPSSPNDEDDSQQKTEALSLGLKPGTIPTRPKPKELKKRRRRRRKTPKEPEHHYRYSSPKKSKRVTPNPEAVHNQYSKIKKDIRDEPIIEQSSTNAWFAPTKGGPIGPIELRNHRRRRHRDDKQAETPPTPEEEKFYITKRLEKTKRKWVPTSPVKKRIQAPVVQKKEEPPMEEVEEKGEEGDEKEEEGEDVVEPQQEIIQEEIDDGVIYDDYDDLGDTESSTHSFLRRLHNLYVNSSFTDPRSHPIPKSEELPLHTLSVTQRLKLLEQPRFSLTIHKCDPLKRNQDVIHPVVRITALNRRTGKLLEKKQGESTLFQKEYVKTMTTDGQAIGGNCQYILPFMTSPYDMRKTKALFPSWEYTLFFNHEYDHFLNPDVILVFEILEFNTTKVKVDQVAWAFLKTRSTSGRANAEKRLRLQLFHYPRNIPQSLMLCTPVLQTMVPTTKEPINNLMNNAKRIQFPYTNALALYRTRFKVKYPSTLYVTLAADKARKHTYVRTRPTSVMEREIGRLSYKTLRNNLDNYDFEDDSDDMSDNDADKQAKEAERLRLLRMRFKREPGERCQIPNKLLYTLESGARGALCVSFSPSGEFLASACVHHNESTTIRIAHIFQSGRSYRTFKDHLGLVYCIRWSSDNAWITTASADSTVRVYSIERDRKKKPLLVTLQHPDFVYSACFHPKHKNILFTGGYDRQIRVYYLPTSDPESAELIHTIDGEKSEFGSLKYYHDARINDLCFVGNDLLAADGSGQLIKYAIVIPSLTEFVKTPKNFIKKHMDIHPSMKDKVSISNIVPIPNKQRVLVHSQDNLLRIVYLDQHNVTKRFSGVKCYLNAQKSTISPDGRILASGSQNGKVFFWNEKSQELIYPQGRDYDFGFPIYDISWSTTEHLVAFSSFGSSEPVRIFYWDNPKNKLAANFKNALFEEDMHKSDSEDDHY